MEFASLLQTAVYTASTAAAVTVFTAAKVACLHKEPEPEVARRPRPYELPIPYPRFKFNLDDWPDSLVRRRLQ